MADIDERRVNGNVMSWASAIWKVGDRRVHGFKALGYADKLETSLVKGSGRHTVPRGQTSGDYSCEPATATVEQETAEQLREAIAALSPTGTSFGTVEFEVVIQFQELRGGAAKVITHELRRCRWSGASTKLELGPDAVYEEMTFQPTSIARDGKVLYDDTDGAP